MCKKVNTFSFDNKEDLTDADEDEDIDEGSEEEETITKTKIKKNSKKRASPRLSASRKAKKEDTFSKCKANNGKRKSSDFQQPSTSDVMNLFVKLQEQVQSISDRLNQEDAADVPVVGKQKGKCNSGSDPGIVLPSTAAVGNTSLEQIEAIVENQVELARASAEAIVYKRKYLLLQQLLNNSQRSGN